MDLFKYKDEVLGRDVAVRFRVKRSDGNEKNYLGTIRRMQVHLDQDNVLEVLHQVIYQDGDEEWYDLEELEASGRLAWINFGNHSGTKAKMPGKGINAKKKPVIKRASKKPKQKRDEEGVSNDSSGLNEVAHQGTKSKKRKGDAIADNVESEGSSTVNIVTPHKPKPPIKRDPPEDELDLPQWVHDMHEWMLNVPHGSKHSTVSETNGRSVMRQVKKLVRGQGITYKNWEEGIVFYEDEQVNLTFNFEDMFTQARQFEALHGKDKGNGWLMQHPITKLQLYKEYRAEKGLPLF
jgi:hypothetical protein